MHDLRFHVLLGKVSVSDAFLISHYVSCLIFLDKLLDSIYNLVNSDVTALLPILNILRCCLILENFEPCYYLIILRSQLTLICVVFRQLVLCKSSICV